MYIRKKRGPEMELCYTTALTFVKEDEASPLNTALCFLKFRNSWKTCSRFAEIPF